MSEAIKFYWVGEESEIFSGKSLDEIKDRKGRMIDGVWVKQEDLQNE